MRVIVFLAAVLLLAVHARADDGPDPNCGPFCLYVAAASLGRHVGTFEEFCKRFGEPDGRGYSLGQLEAMSQSLDLKTHGLKTTVETLALRPPRFACIAWVKGQHFVLINSVADGQLSIIDPPRSYQIPIDTFKTQWDGTALLISSDEILTDEEVIRQFGGTRTRMTIGFALAAIGCLAMAVVKWRNNRAAT